MENGVSLEGLRAAAQDDPNISLKDVFLGALPFAFLMLLVLIVLIRFPILSTALL